MRSFLFFLFAQIYSVWALLSYLLPKKIEILFESPPPRGAGPPTPRGAGNPKGGFSIERNFSSNLDAHCPKNSLNLRIKTGPVTAGADATVYSMSGFYAQCITQYMYM